MTGRPQAAPLAFPARSFVIPEFAEGEYPGPRAASIGFQLLLGPGSRASRSAGMTYRASVSIGASRMAFKPLYTDAQWAEARRLRSEGFTYARIAEQLGFLSAKTVSRRAQYEGWAKRESVPPATARTSAASRRPGANSPATILAVRALALRLFGFVDLELRTLELRMKKKLDDFAKSPSGELPMVTPQEREAFANVIANIKQVTEIASEPAIAADGRRKSVSLDPELTALSDELDAAALAAASAKDSLRREIADKLEALVPPPAGS